MNASAQNNQNITEITTYDEIVEISERLEKVRRELVPAGGKADTLEGETLRAFDRVVYRYYNDGDKYSDCEDDYGYITVRPSVVWLFNNALTKEIKTAANHIQHDDCPPDKEYEDDLLELAKAIKGVDWSKRTPCTCDSRVAKR